MNLYNKIFFIILNFKDFLKVGRNLKSLKRTEFWDKEKLQALQLNKLKLLLKEVNLNVPFWNQVISDNSNYDTELQTNDILKRMPILRKEVIRNNGDRMWSKRIKKYIEATTGGTTGHPLTIRRDYDCHAITRATLWRGRKSWKIDPSDRTLYLNSFGKGTFLGRLRMRLANKQLGEAFPSTGDDIQVINRQILKFKPKVLEGFATGLLATVTKDYSNDINIPVIVSTGEMLYPHQRRLLEDYYSCKVFTYYGSNEIGSIAFECENQQLHICEEHVIVETVDDSGKSVINKPGKVLVTDLDNLAMPFIRYELGDIAVISNKPCSCGRSSNVISELIGRSQDYLSGCEDQKLQATQLAAYLKDLNSTGQLQFVQEEQGTILIYYDGKKEDAKKEIELIKIHLFNRLGTGVELNFKNVKAIKKTNRGKQPLVIRLIKG